MNRMEKKKKNHDIHEWFGYNQRHIITIKVNKMSWPLTPPKSRARRMIPKFQDRVYKLKPHHYFLGLSLSQAPNNT